MYHSYHFSYDSFRTNQLQSTVSVLINGTDPIIIGEYENIYDQFLKIQIRNVMYDFIGSELVQQLDYDFIKVNISDYIGLYITTTQIPNVCK